MKYGDISQTMRDFIGVREAFRRLGFTADELHLYVSGAAEIQGALGVYVRLLAQDKEFLFFCGPVSGSGEAVVAEHERVAAAMMADEMSTEDVERMLMESEAWTRSVQFVLALQGKGFRIPGPESS